MKDFFKKYWVIVLIIVIIIAVIGYSTYKKAQVAKQEAEQAKIEQVLEQQTQASVPGKQSATPQSGPLTPTSNVPGVVLTGTQCRQTLRGKCGRKCLIPRDKCAARKQCWEQSKVLICGWKPSDKLEWD